MIQRVAMIGLGQMGAGMAARLVESEFDVLGYDVNAETVERQRRGGVPATMDLGQAIAGRHTILTSLPDPRAIRASWLGKGGLVEKAEPDSLLIDLSTIDPDTMRQVGEAAEARGLSVLDCPVSGSPGDARAGRLTLMVGGSPDAVARAEPILRALGSSSQQTGGLGTAKVVKLVNNMMSMGNVLVAAEAFALGIAAGVEPNRLFDVLSKSGGRSFHFEKRFPNALRGDFSPGFKLELGEKDLALAIDLGRQMRMPTPAASQVREMFALALAEGYRGQDIVALLSLYRQWVETPQQLPGQTPDQERSPVARAGAASMQG